MINRTPVKNKKILQKNLLFSRKHFSDFSSDITLVIWSFQKKKWLPRIFKKIRFWSVRHFSIFLRFWCLNMSSCCLIQVLNICKHDFYTSRWNNLSFTDVSTISLKHFSNLRLSKPNIQFLKKKIIILMSKYLNCGVTCQKFSTFSSSKSKSNFEKKNIQEKLTFSFSPVSENNSKRGNIDDLNKIIFMFVSKIRYTFS